MQLTEQFAEILSIGLY